MVFASIVFGFTLHAQTLEEAIGSNDPAVLEKALAKKPDVNKADKNGVTPLMSACRQGNLDMVKILLEAGANVNEPKSPKGRTPLMVACAYYSDVEVCKLLIARGADVNAKANDGTTALMLAADNAKAGVVELLLAQKADINVKDKNGKTALDHAQAVDTETLKTGAMNGQSYRMDKDEVVSLLQKAALPNK